MFYILTIAASLAALVLSLYLERSHRCEVAALRAALAAAELRCDTVAWLASQRADAAVRARVEDCRHTLWQAGYDQAMDDIRTGMNLTQRREGAKDRKGKYI